MILLAFIISVNTLLAQHQELQEKPNLWKSSEQEFGDTTSLIYAFKSGKTEGHFRYFFSATDNNKGLSDYFANAFGGGLRYETGKFYGFQLGISGFYIFNIGSSDLSKPDSASKQYNRYEIGLFDLQNPNNKKDIDRLEEFYLKYNYKKSFIRFGRQLINTPFINLQDGRMRPTGVEGVWTEMNELKNLHIEGGWIYSVSPRSTVKWFSTAQSVGLYPMGVNTDGKKSDYADNLKSKGAFLLGSKFKTLEWMSISLYDLYFENVLNSVLLQADLNYKFKPNTYLIGGLQFIRQDAVNNGGNKDQEKTYINKGASAMTAGAQAGLKHNNWEFTLNYNRIFNNGRYLMPREWGREPFFTFLPRERNEGFGNVHALMGKLNYNFPELRIKTSLGIGYYKLPDVKYYEMNKYGLPSYTQINADIRYSFNRFFKGLNAQFLMVAKLNNGNLYGDKRYEINKVNMILYNLVLNYYF